MSTTNTKRELAEARKEIEGWEKQSVLFHDHLGKLTADNKAMKERLSEVIGKEWRAREENERQVRKLNARLKRMERDARGKAGRREEIALAVMVAAIGKGHEAETAGDLASLCVEHADALLARLANE